MAGAGEITLRAGCKTGLGGEAEQTQVGDVIFGYGTPTYVGAAGTVLYVKLDATPGTSSVYRHTTVGTGWTAMSDA